jgi:hypothetical protein
MSLLNGPKANDSIHFFLCTHAELNNQWTIVVSTDTDENMNCDTRNKQAKHNQNYIDWGKYNTNTNTNTTTNIN